MTYQVRVIPSERVFQVDGRDSLLDSALRTGLAVNYGCSNGNCGLCQVRLLSGKVEPIRHHDYVIGEANKRMGYMLLCSYTAKSNLLIETDEAHSTEDIRRQQIAARLKKRQNIGDDILILNVQTPRTTRLRFLAGQQVVLTVGPGLTQAHAIASCPCDDRNLEFHMCRGASDAFSRYVFSTLNPSDSVQIVGPTGGFQWQEDSSRPAIFIAYDTGFAPIKSLLEHTINTESTQPIDLYWFAFREGGHYMHNLARSWGDVLDNFKYHPLTAVVAQNRANRPLEPPGLDSLLDGVFRDDNLAGSDFYISGPLRAIATTQEYCLRRGVDRSQLQVQAIDCESTAV